MKQQASGPPNSEVTPSQVKAALRLSERDPRATLRTRPAAAHTGAATSMDGMHWEKRGRVISPSGWEGSYIAANGTALAEGDGFYYWYQAGDPSMHNAQDDALAQKIDYRLNPGRYQPDPPPPPEPERSPSVRIKRKKKEDPNAPPEPSGLPPPEHKFLDFDLDSAQP